MKDYLLIKKVWYLLTKKFIKLETSCIKDYLELNKKKQLIIF